jgi:hypothetical protein
MCKILNSDENVDADADAALDVASAPIPLRIIRYGMVQK